MGKITDAAGRILETVLESEVVNSCKNQLVNGLLEKVPDRVTISTEAFKNDIRELADVPIYPTDGSIIVALFVDPRDWYKNSF